MLGPTYTLKMLISGTFESMFSVKVGDLMLTEYDFSHEDEQQLTQTRALIRGTI